VQSNHARSSKPEAGHALRSGWPPAALQVRERCGQKGSSTVSDAFTRRWQSSSAAGTTPFADVVARFLLPDDAAQPFRRGPRRRQTAAQIARAGRARWTLNRRADFAVGPREPDAIGSGRRTVRSPWAMIPISPRAIGELPTLRRRRRIVRATVSIESVPAAAPESRFPATTSPSSTRPDHCMKFRLKRKLKPLRGEFRPSLLRDR